MEMFNKNLSALRPNYDFPLPSLQNDCGSRGLVYRAISSDSYVLDVGCDTGRFGEALHLEKNCIVHGIELDLDAAEIAKSRIDRVITRAIKNEDSFEGLGEYDAVLFLDVLEHLENPWAVLKGAFKALKLGGNIHVVVPNVAHIAIVRRLIQGQFEYTQHGSMDRTHLRWFTRKSIKQALEEAGFINVQINVTPQIPFLSSNSKINTFLSQQLTKIFPDQLGGSIVVQAEKPNIR